MSRDVIRWIAPAIAALFLISVVAIGALFFLAAYFEKRRLVPLASAGSDAPPERSGKAGILLAAAETLDFRHLGYFVDRQGFTHPRLSLLISADRQVLAMIVHGRLARFKLIGRLPHGRLLITSQNPEEPDLSLLRVELLEAGRLDEALARHTRWLREMQFPTLAFDPQTVVEDLLEHDRLRARNLVSAGHARWREVDQSSWSYTLRCSITMAIQCLKDVRKGVELRREAQKQRPIGL